MVTTRAANRARPAPAGRTRRWASGRELDHIEQLSFAYRALLHPGSVLRILPVGVDANVLLNSVARLASGRPSDLLGAARLGLIRIYVGESVPGEVERALAWRARKADVPVGDLERI